MEKEERDSTSIQQQNLDGMEENEAIELVLFQVSEFYVYIIPPRKTASSYRADEWDVNKWSWEGSLKVISKGEECIVRLEDKTTGELYARAFLRKGEPHPVEPVIDSSRYFVLRVEENIGGRLRHAFIGIGFRERTQAYDFQAALHDHMKYLNKKEAAEEMEQQYQNNSSADYSLKEGETLVLQLKSTKICKSTKFKVSEHGQKNSSEEKGSGKEPVISIKPPPPPPATLSPTSSANRSVENSPPSLRLEETNKDESKEADDDDFGKLKKFTSNQGIQNVQDGESEHASASESTLDVPDDDFGDFQAAG